MRCQGEIINIVLGLGSNLGSPLAMLRAAADGIESLLPLLGAQSGPCRRGEPVEVVARSRVVQSVSVGGPPQPDYLNAAVLVRTSLTPKELLARTLRLEQRLGRRRPEPVRWGPRVIDIDLLWIPGCAVATADLQIPHPRLRERSFALVPLLELVPDAVDPASGERYAELAAAQVSLPVIASL